MSGEILSSRIRARLAAALVSAVVLLVVSAPARADVYPEDFPGCNPSAGDDTNCWQRALNAAKAPSGTPYFGKVTAEGGKTYIIKNTLTITQSLGGVIDGNGATLVWQGANANVPMFLLANNQRLKITNLSIRSDPGYPLRTAIEYTKTTPVIVSPRYNVLDSVFIDGTDLGGLQYGVHFSSRYGQDSDNDQSTIINSTISNVTNAAIYIAHSQSHDHRFISVNATGAPNNARAAFVKVSAGSFTSIDGFHGRFGLANYYLSDARTGIRIINENSEGSAAFIKTPTGVSTAPHPVQVIGGRFAVDALQTNGRVIDFHRYGPLLVDGLRIDGNVPAGVPVPSIYFWPEKNNGQGGYAELRVTGVQFHGVMPSGGTNRTDPIVVNSIARVTAGSNSCLTADGQTTHCAGRAHGSSPGIVFADLAGSLLNTPGQFFYCSDCGRSSSTGACQAGGTGRFARRLSAGWFCE